MYWNNVTDRSACASCRSSISDRSDTTLCWHATVSTALSCFHHRETNCTAVSSKHSNQFLNWVVGHNEPHSKGILFICEAPECHQSLSLALWWVARFLSFLFFLFWLNYSFRRTRQKRELEMFRWRPVDQPAALFFYYPAMHAGPPLPSWRVCVWRSECELQPRPVRHQSCPQTLHLSAPLHPAPRCC